MAGHDGESVGLHRPRVEVRVLGPLELDVDGERAELGGPRLRALITLLALEARSPVSVSRLIETLWDGEEPDGARNAVQVYTSRLRKSLAAAGPTLRAVPGGYLLDIPPDRVDATRFERLVDAGRAQLTAGEPGAAAETLSRALALWRGDDALTELGSGGEGLRARLEARRVAAQTGLVDAELARGRHAAVLPSLEELVRRYPLDEHVAAALMVALYRSGRQADALSAYAAAARRLDDELGVQPGAELRSVHQQVLRHQVPEIAGPGPRVAPVPATAATSTGTTGGAATGVDPVPITAAAGSPTAGPSPPAGGGRDPTDGPASADRTAEPAADPIGPADRTFSQPALGRARLPLVGRDGDLELIDRLLADPQVRVVTLVGLGGAGKSRLAIEVARQRAAVVEVLVIALAGTEDPTAVLPAVCRVAGLTASWVREPPLEVAARGLAGRRVLLVLDNLEQLLDRSRSDGPGLAELDDLLDRLPDLTLLCTSRMPVQLAGEFLVPLGPLPVPPADVVDPESVLSYPAARLFRDRARAASPSFEVTPDNAADVAATCRMLDGLPLALELAAARVRLLPPAVIARRREDRLGLLGDGPRHLPDRHRSIRAALDWSVALLDDDERDVFGRLSVFAGGWTLDAAERVCASRALAAPEVFGVLARLADKSLVVADGSGRMGILDLVREYAAGLLARAPGDAEGEARQAHTDYFLDLAERLGQRLGGGLDPETRSTLDPESANFAVTLDRLHTTGDSERLARLVVVLLDYWFYSGALADADRWLAVAEAADVPAHSRAQLLMTAGSRSFVSGDLRAARTSYDAAFAVAVVLGDDALLARIMTLLGVIDRYGGELDVALDRLDAARRFAQRAAASTTLAVIDNECGEILLDLGRTAQARPLIEALRDRAASSESLDQVATTTAHLALLACMDGDDQGARQLIGAARATAERTGVTPALADVLLIAGLLELRLGAPAGAVGILRTALRVNHDVALLISLPGIVSLLGAALVRAGEAVAGARLLATGRAWRRQRGIHVVYALAAELIEAAEAEIGTQVAPDALLAATAAGEAAPFGSIDALQALIRETVIDIRRTVPRQPTVQLGEAATQQVGADGAVHP